MDKEKRFDRIIKKNNMGETRMQARQVTIFEKGIVKLTTQDLEPKENQVLVKTRFSSICGTDKNYFKHIVPPATHIIDPSHSHTESKFAYPMRVGHEGAGEVVAVGKHVTDFKVGDPVMNFGWSNTMSDYFVQNMPHEGYGVCHMTDGLTWEEASLAEPTACAIYAGMNSGVKLGDTVAVVGSGYAGQVMMQVVRCMGAKKIIALDLIPGKLELAKSLAADICIDASNPEEALDKIVQETNGYGVDVALEVAGNSESIDFCSKILKHGGILGLYSWIINPITVYVNRWHNNGFDIRTLALMHRIGHDKFWWIDKALSNVANGMINIKPLISHTFDLEDCQKAFDVASLNDHACKVMLRGS